MTKLTFQEYIKLATNKAKNIFHFLRRSINRLYQFKGESLRAIFYAAVLPLRPEWGCLNKPLTRMGFKLEDLSKLGNDSKVIKSLKSTNPISVLNVIIDDTTTLSLLKNIDITHNTCKKLFIFLLF